MRGDRHQFKLAYIMSRFPKITETFILYEILELIKKGFQVEIYPILRERKDVEHPEVIQLEPHVHYTPFISTSIIRANLSFIIRRPLKYFKMVGEVITKTFGSLNFFIGALGILPKSVRFAYEIEMNGISHVHAHFANHPALSALIINRLTTIPFSFTGHGSDIHTEQRMLDRKIQAADFVVMISKYNKNFVIDKFGNDFNDNLKVIHCGVDPQVFAPLTMTKPHGCFTILCVASFREVKGHAYLIDACRILRQRGIEFVCHLIGDGSLRSKIKKQIADSGLENRVVLHGSLPRPEVVQFMGFADTVVLASILASRGNREGIPVVLMEAMACAIPVVSSQLSGIPELVETGLTGILTPTKDSDAIADALEKLSRDPELRYRMGVAGREKVLKDFNLRKNTGKLAELFLSKICTTSATRW